MPIRQLAFIELTWQKPFENDYFGPFLLGELDPAALFEQGNGFAALTHHGQHHRDDFFV